MSNSNREAIERFYYELFGDAVSETAQLVLWTPRDKRTFWTSSIEEAVAVSESAAAASDIYFGLCLQDREAARIEKAKRTEVEPEQVDMNYCRWAREGRAAQEPSRGGQDLVFASAVSDQRPQHRGRDSHLLALQGAVDLRGLGRA